MASERLDVILNLITGNYKSEARAAATATGQIGGAAQKASTGTTALQRGVAGVESSLKRFASPLVLGAVIGGLGKMALQIGENADRLFDLKAQTGASTDQLQEYEFVAQAAGAKTEFFTDSIKQVIRSLDQAQAGTGAVSDAYRKLGIDVLDTNGRIRSGADITEEIIDKLAGMANVTERNALAQDIFGKKWEEVVSVLDLGTEAISNLKDEAHELGVVISEEALVAADRLRENFAKLRAAASAQAGLALVNIGSNIAAWFGDEASKDLIVYSEALNRITRRMEQGVPAWEAFSEALFRVVESSDLTTEELLDLASAAGFAVEEMTDEQWEQFSLDLIKQAMAAGMDAEAINELRLALLAASPEALALAQAALEGEAALEGQEDAATESRDRLHQLADAQRDATRAFLESANPAIQAAAAIQRYQEAQKKLDDVLKDVESTEYDVAAAQLEVVRTALEAQGALDAFSAANPQAQIQLIADVLRISDEEARKLLETLGIIDGTNVAVTFNYRTFTTPDAASPFIPPSVRPPSSGTNIINARQHGGPAYAGRPYMVGENGAELFIPQRSGMVLSASATRQLLAGMSGGGGDWNINLNGVHTVDRGAIDLLGTMAGVQRRVEARR